MTHFCNKLHCETRVNNSFILFHLTEIQKKIHKPTDIEVSEWGKMEQPNEPNPYFIREETFV